MELTVLSGKGGTGKTTVAAGLAAHWSGRALLVDADVDAANLHLVLRPTIERVEAFTGGWIPRRDPDRCTGCGTCGELCRFGAISGGWITRAACEGCGLCALACPHGALEMVPRRSGEWFAAKTPYGRLLFARLLPGEGNSGKLVSLLREEGRRIAAEAGITRIVSDGPPGVGCPAMASLAGADAILAVAEPSTSGLHDLRRVLDLGAHFRIPCFTVVNKADLAPALARAIGDECRVRQVPLLGRIPHDPAVLACLEEGRPITHRPTAPAARELMRVSCKLEAVLDDLESARSGAAALTPGAKGRTEGGRTTALPSRAWGEEANDAGL